jgi:flagellin
MSMVIGTNIASLSAQRHLSNSRADMETSMERLASGKRINSAMDDAAGLAITHKLESKITGLNQGVRNANDGISMLQTAEGALEETSAILIRMKELATQASSSTYSSTDRDSLDLEFQALLNEITRISATTDFNGTQLLQNDSSATFVVGDQGSDTVSISLQAMSSKDLGIDGTGVVNETGIMSITTENGATAKQAGTFTMAAVVQAGEYLEMSVNGKTFTQAFSTDETTTMTLLADKINSGTDGLTATRSASKVITLTSTEDGKAWTSGGIAEFTATVPINETAVDSITTENGAAAKKAGTFTMAAVVQAGEFLEMEVNGTTYKQNFDTSETVTMTLLADQITNGANDVTATRSASKVITLTSTVNGANWTSGGLREFAQGTGASGLQTADAAAKAISTIESAIAKVDNYRSDLGAASNRLDHTVSNLLNRVETQSAAKSRISDADFAVESANLAKSQVLQQAGTAMLAQANATGQSVLSLLK